MKLKHALPAAMLALAAICAHAQTQAPGFREHSFTMKSQQVGGAAQIGCISDEACTGTSSTTTQTKGQPQQMTMETCAKWLSADCDGVKPVGAPPTK